MTHPLIYIWKPDRTPELVGSNTAYSSSDSATAYSFDFTAQSATNACLIIGVGLSSSVGASNPITQIVYGNSTLTAAVEAFNDSGAIPFDHNVGIYYLIGPSTTSTSITINMNTGFGNPNPKSIAAVAGIYKNVRQASPIGTIYSTAYDAVSSISTSITPSYSRSMFAIAFGAGDLLGPITPGAGINERRDVDVIPDLSFWFGDSSSTSAATKTITLTGTASTDAAFVIAEFRGAK